ncbi:MAG: Trk family potassium uptake protein [Eubacteriaceae bacterium]|nr:Trk family potassium uptake protein [Eubacteriaceae bacterium]
MNIKQHLRKLSQSQILSFGFITLILLGTILLMLPVSSAEGVPTNFIDCLFTATSATCVTGLTIFDTGTYWSTFGQLVIITLIQIGGVGFMSLTTIVFLMLGRKISIKNRMLIQSSLSLDSAEGIVKYVKSVLMFTFITECIGAVLLFTRFVRDYPLMKAVYFSVFHSVSAFCNAGFDIFGGGISLMGYTSSPTVTLTISMLIVLGGIGFTVAMDVLEKKGFRKLSFNSKIVLSTTLTLLIFGFVFMLFSEYNNSATIGNMPLWEKILTSLFASVTPRTAGFFSIDYSKVTTIGYLVTIILMFIGGSPGSTAGGIKTSAIAVILVSVYSTVKGRDDMNIFGRRITEQTLRKAFVMAFMPFVWTIFAVMIISMTNSLPLHDILFETVSAIATVGLTTGITTKLNALGKILIAMSMFFGRVGIMTIAYAIARKREDINAETSSFRYPEGNLML